MATRIKEWMIPYTWWDGIEITDNHVINVLLRAANNLIHVNEDRELYVDLQLPAGIAPDDEFPVGVTTGEILAEDWWEQSGTIINSKTTSGDYVRLIYANDWNLYYDPGTWVWIMIGIATQIDVNTKTFFLTGTTWETNLAAAQAAIDWYLAWKNPLLIYDNRCYALAGHTVNQQEESAYIFAAPTSTYTVYGIDLVYVDPVQTITRIQTNTSDKTPRTTTFLMPAGTWVSAKYTAQLVLNWYLNNYEYYSSNKYNPIIISTDDNNAPEYTYYLTWTNLYNPNVWDPWLLVFTSQLITYLVPTDMFVKAILINYVWTTVTSVSRETFWVGKYRAWSWITIDDSTHEISANIQWALVFKWTVADVASLPSTWNTTGDTYYVTADGVMYSWDWTQRVAVGNTQIDLSNYFDMTVNTTDDITQGSTNLFVTQAMIDAWNWKQWALTAWTNIQINNWVISATDTTYSAGTWIWITWTTINNTAPFSPENAGTVGQVLKRTSTGARWWNEMSIQGTTFWSLMTACANNWREHVTYYSNESNVNSEWTANYTFQWLGWIRIKSFHWASWQASMRINGVTVLIEQTWSWPYTVKLWLWPFTMWPWDAVTFYTEQWGSAATLEAYVFDYY